MILLMVVTLGTHSIRPDLSVKGTTEYVRISKENQCQGMENFGKRMKLTKLSLARVCVRLEEFIEDGEEVHKTGVFPQVVLGLPREHINLPVTA